MKSIDFGNFTKTGKDIEEFAIALLSFYFGIKIIGNQILGIKDAKKLFRALNLATSSKLQIKIIDEKVINQIHSGQIGEVKGTFNGITITANEDSTIATIVAIYKQVNSYRSQVTGN